MMKAWFKSGAPWVWLNAAAVSTCLILVIGYWVGVYSWCRSFLAIMSPCSSIRSRRCRAQNIIGEQVDTSITPAVMARASGHKMESDDDILVQHLLKTGNRDLTGMDFRWIVDRNIKQQTYPAELIVLERREWGNFYGHLVEPLKKTAKTLQPGQRLLTVLQTTIARCFNGF